jgi:hypothetical protein
VDHHVLAGFVAGAIRETAQACAHIHSKPITAPGPLILLRNRRQLAGIGYRRARHSRIALQILLVAFANEDAGVGIADSAIGPVRKPRVVRVFPAPALASA